MELFFRPRRPLARMAAAATTSGIAYHGAPAVDGADHPSGRASYLPPRPAPEDPTVGAPPAEATAREPAPGTALPNLTDGLLEDLELLHLLGALTHRELRAARNRLLAS